MVSSRVSTPAHTFGIQSFLRTIWKKTKNLNSSVTFCCESKLMWECWSHIALPRFPIMTLSLRRYGNKWRLPSALLLPASASRGIKNTEVCNYFVGLDIMQISDPVWVNGWFLMDHGTWRGYKCNVGLHECTGLYADTWTCKHMRTRYHRNTHVLVIVLSGTAGEPRRHGNCCGRKH